MRARHRSRSGRTQIRQRLRHVFKGLEQAQMGFKAVEEARFEQRAFQQRDRSGLQGVERGDEVAAVDGGHGNGQERLQSVRRVPVVKVAAVERQLCHGRVTAMHEVSELRRGQETEFAGSLARVEEQTEISGGNAGGFEEAFFLDVVGDEVVVARAAELMKEAPDPEGIFAQEEVVFVMQLLAWLAGRAVEPSRDVALEAPQDQDGRGGHQGDGMGEAHDGSEEDGDNRCEREVAVDRGRAALG